MVWQLMACCYDGDEMKKSKTVKFYSADTKQTDAERRLIVAGCMNWPDSVIFIKWQSGKPDKFLSWNQLMPC